MRFDAVDTGTRVTVEHFGWDAIPQEHAARHGFPLDAFQQRDRRVVAGAAAVRWATTSPLSAGRAPRVAWPDGRSTARAPAPRRPAATPAAAPSPPPAREPSHAERCRTLVHGERRGRALDAGRRSRRVPVRLGGELRPRRRRRPALLRQPHGRAHPERAARPAGEPARHRAGPRGCRSARQRTGHAARTARRRSTTTIATSPATRYLEANPAASYYIDFGDFTFLRLTVDHIRYVGGYGRMSWVDAAEYARRDARSAGRRRRRDHRAHERRPRRRAGVVLPALRRAARHDVGHRCRRSTATASTWWP